MVWMFCGSFCSEVGAQNQSCTAIHAMAQMVRADSVDDLNTWKDAAGDDRRARGIYVFRRFELEPMNRAAAYAVLATIPQTEEEDSEWFLLGGRLCTNEEVADMYALADLSARRPHDLAMVVILVPDKMVDYVSYAEIAVQNPDSDYAEQMETVCRSKNAEFLNAVNQLPPARKKWFVTKIFDPHRCHALAHPEAQ